MTGTAINVTLIIVGGLMGYGLKREAKPTVQLYIRFLISLLLLYAGFALICSSFSGGILRGLGQLSLIMVSLVAGNYLGRALHIQVGMNHVAVFARKCLAPETQKSESNFGFLLATGLFCITPLAFLGSLTEGMTGAWLPLAIKGAMDGMAAFSFTRSFGWSVILSAIPVLALQGSLTLLANFTAENWVDSVVVDSFAMIAGCLTLTVIPILLGYRFVRLGDYLPSLFIAPLLSQLWW